MKFSKLVVFVFVFLAYQGNNLNAHCEIPCGIYDDEARIKLILEHATTVEKSMNQIISLENKADTNSNQYVRWVMNKEDHANEIQDIVSQYFMTQRIKPDTDNYDKKLSLLHKMLLSAMKSKQTTDTAHVEEIRRLVKDFEKLYFK